MSAAAMGGGLRGFPFGDCLRRGRLHIRMDMPLAIRRPASSQVLNHPDRSFDRLALTQTLTNESMSEILNISRQLKALDVEQPRP